MSAPLRLLLLCSAVYMAAFLAKLLLVPDIVPITWSEGPQPLWQVQIAFLLSALQNIAVLVVLLIALVAVLRAIERQIRAMMPVLRVSPDQSTPQATPGAAQTIEPSCPKGETPVEA